MKKPIRQRLRKPVFILLIGFVILFIFRMIYGYSITTDDESVQVLFEETIINVRKNYASKEYKVNANSLNQSVTKVDQKYEKIAEVNTKSNKFKEEEALLRQQIAMNDAIIQFEQKKGNEGNRKLNLSIGVPPEKFDTLYNNLIKIGKVRSKQITKNDKTNEYKELNAKKVSLEKVLASLIELKSKGGKIEEYIDLENRILEIEQQLQNLGVNLGNFDDENEFCTVKFSLHEGKELKISFIQRIKVALEWTVKIYLRIMATMAFLTLFAYLVLLVIDKLKILEGAVNRNE